MNNRTRRTTLGVVILALVGLLTPLVWSDGEERGEWVVPERHARKINPVPADEESVARGKTFYRQLCVPCHGEAGKGDGPAGVELTVRPSDLSLPTMWKQTDGTLYRKILRGRAPMPAFAGKLKRAERWDVVNYLRTLAPKPEPEEDDEPSDNQDG